jgi:3-oxoacyl-[acyl-carrier-protein] synthase III
MAVVGVGGFVPEEVWTNERLMQRVPDTTDEWIRSRTGIASRRFASDEDATSDLAVRAAREALRSGNVDAEAIGLLIVATSTPDYQLPSCASLVQAQLGATACTAFDVNATCSGFLHAVDVAWRYVRDGTPYALVIGADTYSRILDWGDRTTAVLFGDGAGAIVLAAETHAPARAPRIVRTWFRTDGTRADHVIVPGGGSRAPHDARVFRMRGRDVKKFAVEAFQEVVRELCRREEIALSQLTTLVPHQANARIIEEALSALGLDPSLAPMQVREYGNTAAASIPLALCDRWTDVGRGAYTALVGFGGGLSWGGVLLRGEDAVGGRQLSARGS